MQPQASSRKRPAPGNSPLVQQQAAYQYPPVPESTDFTNENFLDFSNQYSNNSAYTDPTVVNNNAYTGNLNGTQADSYNAGIAQPGSTDLVRRSRGQQQQQLATRNNQQEQWNGGLDGGSGPVMDDDEDEQALNMKIQMAKQDAQGKRKTIPPFVQKLSSFLDNNNTELIRWSDDGKSFIVLDEDEFARTLIPELFKHNNYASFVRQLNMYGFHKTINIKDNSLKAAERARKGVKPPSMYTHRYFRRNRPDMLWLIQKPSGKAGGAKRKRDGDRKEAFDSDDERHFSPDPEGRQQGAIGPANGAASGDLTTLPRSELAVVRQELQKLQAQQNIISSMINQLREQNEKFYRQATTFQALHDRHENSINAILTFLATFYNRSLEGHAGQNLANMFSGAMPQDNQQHGTVEDVGDGYEGSAEPVNQMQRYRRPLLLPAPSPNSQTLQPGTSSTAPNSVRASPSPPADGLTHRARTSSAQPPPGTQGPSASPQMKNDAPTPNMLDQLPESEDMMSLINSVNATNASTPNTAAPALDFSSALDHYQNANGHSPLTKQQRDDVLSMMANQQQGNSSGNNNALVSPNPPAMPSLEQYTQTQKQLEMLTNLQKEQDQKVQDLNRRLQPLSPTGAIPGLTDENGTNYFADSTGAPGDFDLGDFINDDNAFAGDGSDLNFDFNGTGTDGTMPWDVGNSSNTGEMFQTNDGTLGVPEQGQHEGGRVESVSSEATSPAATVPEADDPGTPKKRQRRQ